jgi:hypothetical protein
MRFPYRRVRTGDEPAAVEPSNSWSATQPSSDRPLQLRGMTLTQSYAGLPGEPFHVGWSQDGRSLAATSEYGGVAIWSDAGNRHGSWMVMRTTRTSLGSTGTQRIQCLRPRRSTIRSGYGTRTLERFGSLERMTRSLTALAGRQTGGSSP